LYGCKIDEIGPGQRAAGTYLAPGINKKKRLVTKALRVLEVKYVRESLQNDKHARNADKRRCHVILFQYHWVWKGHYLVMYCHRVVVNRGNIQINVCSRFREFCIEIFVEFGGKNSTCRSTVEAVDNFSPFYSTSVIVKFSTSKVFIFCFQPENLPR
jgi:hypothetical protein